MKKDNKMTDLTWCLSPHGKTYNVAVWVVSNYKMDVYQTKMQEMWVKASEQVIQEYEAQT